MPWVRIDDQMPEHPKVERVGHLAAWLNVAALCYANRNLTDGFIPNHVVPRLTTIPQPKRHAKLLVSEGLWERADGGFAIHDYHEFQPSADTIRKARIVAAQRQARFRNGVSNGVTNGVTGGVSNGVSNAPSNGHVTRSPLPPPSSSVVENSLPRVHEAIRDEVEAPRLSKDDLHQILAPAKQVVRADGGTPDLEEEPW